MSDIGDASVSRGGNVGVHLLALQREPEAQAGHGAALRGLLYLNRMGSRGRPYQLEAGDGVRQLSVLENSKP